VLSSIRFDMRAPASGPASPAALYRASLDMAAWADRVGIGSVVLSEHHGAEDGFLPSPVVAAAAIAGRTERITITIGALLLPLHDPVRVAEDLAVLDLLSEGRVSTVLGLGYREEEYAMFGAPWEGRGAHFDGCIQVLLDAWSGEPFEHRGCTVRVTPRPGTDLRATTFVGGRSLRAARRAARFALPFFPDSGDPALRAEYERACREHGRRPGLVITPEPQVHYLFVSEDPDGYWDRIGAHLLHEALTYGSWQPEGSPSSAATDATTIEELRAGDLFTVLRPDEAVRWAAGRPVLLLYPLCGGLPPEVAWESLQLVEHEVLPRLQRG
jgi:alkanesulfonate monooxygenase SsuD/methylene tetrahydromethanopterin reductase-like flavin-dependent oxidoreductase (luciferase family)